MIQKEIKTILIVLSCVFLVSCTGERRVDGEMPFDSDSLMNMAESFLQAGDYGNAMRLYQRAANENPKHLPSRLGLAQTYQAMGATDASINFYEQVLRLDPNNMDAKMGSGQMLITKNRPADAIPYLTDLAMQEPNNYRIYNMLGLAHDLLGKQEEAQMNYGRGLTLAADNISLLNNLALSFAFEEQYAPSIKLLSKAINLDYTVTKAQHNLVLVYILSGEEEAGRKIGTSIMTSAELETNIRRYNWIKSLSAKNRAQAIFLGIKDFPDEVTPRGKDGVSENKYAPVEVISNDPKKRQLQELLRQEEDAVTRKKKSIVNKTPEPSKTNALGQKIHKIQLGSYPTTKLAYDGWQDVKRRSKDVLASYAPTLKLVKLADGKNLFRLFVGNFDDKIFASSLCEELQNMNVDCLVLLTEKD